MCSIIYGSQSNTLGLNVFVRSEAKGKGRPFVPFPYKTKTKRCFFWGYPSLALLKRSNLTIDRILKVTGLSAYTSVPRASLGWETPSWHHLKSITEDPSTNENFLEVLTVLFWDFLHLLLVYKWPLRSYNPEEKIKSNLGDAMGWKVGCSFRSNFGDKTSPIRAEVLCIVVILPWPFFGK